jgi:tetratricopeptide (TPR) repeat protein
MLATSHVDESLRTKAREAHEKARLSHGPEAWAEPVKLWASIATAPDGDKWDRFFYAEALLRSGDAASALPIAQSLLITDREMLRPAWMLMAEALERLGRMSEAEAAWRQTLALSPNEYWAHYGIARALMHQGRSTEARDAIDKALQSPEAEPGALRFATSLDLAAGDYAAADSKFDRLGLSPDARIEAIVSSLGGMTRVDDRMAMYRLAKQVKGKGQFVDLGCFLGSLTVPMGLGLKSNSDAMAAGVRVHSYDRFQWEAGMDPFFSDLDGAVEPTAGADFRPIFQRRIGSVADLVVVHAEDLSKARWTGGPIELMAIDAMGTPELSRRICREFYPSLIPGISHVLHKDFCYHYTWWIHILQYQARDFFEVADTMPGAASVLFRCTRTISSLDANKMAGWNTKDGALADAAFAYSLSIVAPQDAHAIAAAHVRWYLASGERTKAEQLLKEANAKYGASEDLAAVQADVNSRI